MAKEMAKGFTCECGTEHKFGAYVFGHWHEYLIHTCESCGAKHSVCEGVVKLQKTNKKSK